MSEDCRKKIGIIGAGAAGLAAAVTASNVLINAEGFSAWHIDLFEKNSEPGKKLIATGNGKCNITNINADYFEVCRSFFSDLGILLAKEDEGRMYPHSKQAKTVRDTLVDAAENNGVNIISDCEIKNIEADDKAFILTDSSQKTYKYEKLLLTTGGKAGMQFGSGGEGLRFARKLGLQTSTILPALVPLTYGENPEFDLKKLKGVRAEANVTLSVSGQNVAEEKGEVQFTDYGLSGICIFNLSRLLKDAPRSEREIIHTEIIIDFAPEYDEEQLITLFDSNLEAGLNGVVNEKIAKTFLDAGIDPKRNSIRTARLLKAFPISINGTKGWKEAQVTSGGVLLSEIDAESMECVNIKNLFLAGEILDYDGPCGGYNLSWAWRTGIQAGLGILDGIEADD